MNNIKRKVCQIYWTLGLYSWQHLSLAICNWLETGSEFG